MDLARELHIESLGCLFYGQSPRGKIYSREGHLRNRKYIPGGFRTRYNSKPLATQNNRKKGAEEVLFDGWERSVVEKTTKIGGEKGGFSFNKTRGKFIQGEKRGPRSRIDHLRKQWGTETRVLNLIPRLVVFYL